MEATSERNRLRAAGRIPRETLDYLSAKNREDRRRLRVLQIPTLVIAAVFLFVSLVVMRREGLLAPHHSLPFLTIGLLAAILVRGMRRLFQ